MVCSPHFYHLRIDRRVALPSFIAWQLNQEPCQQRLRDLAVGSFSASIKMTDFQSLVLLLPPLERQAEILEVYDLQKWERRCLAALIGSREREMAQLAWDLEWGDI